MKERKIIYRNGKELLTDVYTLTFAEVSRLARMYMDANLRGEINDAESSNKFLDDKLKKIN